MVTAKLGQSREGHKAGSWARGAGSGVSAILGALVGAAKRRPSSRVEALGAPVTTERRHWAQLRIGNGKCPSPAAPAPAEPAINPHSPLRISGGADRDGLIGTGLIGTGRFEGCQEQPAEALRAPATAERQASGQSQIGNRQSKMPSPWGTDRDRRPDLPKAGDEGLLSVWNRSRID
jgi:hypothetical protein